MGKLRSDHIYEMNVNTVNVDDMASVTVYESKYINQLKALAEKHPDEIKIIPTGLAGVVLAHLPKKYVHISFYESSKREMSEEQKVAAAERLKKAREKKAESNE